MEEERHKEESKAEEKDIVISTLPLLPRKPYPWLMISDGENDSDRHIFYSITEDHYYERFVPELRYMHVLYCYGGLLVLKDKYIDDWSILNILTMEKLQLPSLPTSHQYIHPANTSCVMSSAKMDRSCRVIFFERGLLKFWSCHLGDSELIERESTYRGLIRDLINFKGKLYTLTAPDLSLIVSDFSDPELHHEQVVRGESILIDCYESTYDMDTYLVESFDDLLLICMGTYDSEVSYVKIFKADLSIGAWVKLETLGDRAIFLNLRRNNFSSPSTAVGMKGNVIYWVRPPFSWHSPERHLYMYDVEDQSISISLPCPIVGTSSALSWVSFPTTYNEDNKPEHTPRSSLFGASEIETAFHVHKDTVESMELQIGQRNSRKREETETIDSPTVLKNSTWTDLPNDLLQEIFPHLLAGDRVVFRSVCRSWYSASLSPCKSSHQSVVPLKSSDSSPFLMCPDKKMFHPTNEKLFSMDFSHIPVGCGKIRATRNGWLLMEFNSSILCFYNPITKAEIMLPDLDAFFLYSVYFSAPQKSAECVVLVAAMMRDYTRAICYIKSGDNFWSFCKITQEQELFHFSSCNAVGYKGLYYFLGYDAKLLIFDPKDIIRIIEAPKFISELTTNSRQQYMLESDGMLIVVFVATDGSTVYTCKWNVSSSKWEVLESLGNMMLFISRPLSLCKRATLRGTGNNIYFPRAVGDGHILFYSLATRRYHTFELGSYRNFFESKFYPEYNGWFML